MTDNATALRVALQAFMAIEPEFSSASDRHLREIVAEKRASAPLAEAVLLARRALSAPAQEPIQPGHPTERSGETPTRAAIQDRADAERLPANWPDDLAAIAAALPEPSRPAAAPPPQTSEPDEDEVLGKFERAGFRYDGQSLWKASLYTNEMLALANELAGVRGTPAGLTAAHLEICKPAHLRWLSSAQWTDSDLREFADAIIRRLSA